VIAAAVAQGADGPRPLSTLLEPGVDLLRLGTLVVLGLTIAVHVGFAIAVWMHARRQRPVLAPAPLWTLATLLGGVFVAVAYWFVHHFATAAAKGEPSRTGGVTRP
jgi:hypothetical protein